MSVNKSHIITIAGRPGSGKSTTAKGVAKKLNFKHVSSGDLFRAVAKKNGLDVLSANLSAEQNAEIDHQTDEWLRDIGRKDKKLVIDSRLAWHWMPKSFKVFLDLDLETAAKRIMAHNDENRAQYEEIPEDIAQYVEELKKRLASEKRRYKKLYDVDVADHDNYDLIVDTANNNIPQVIKIVHDAYEAWLKN